MDEHKVIKAVAASSGTQTGAIVRCAFDKNQEGVLPQFVGKAVVTSDGYLMCDFIDRGGARHMGAFVGSVDDLESNLVLLATHVGMTTEETTEFRKRVFSSWVAEDYRT